MIDRDKLKDILTEYKRDFPQRWPLEKYKWEAVRCFQTAWDFTARDFEEMFTAATARTKDLLTSVNYYPRGVMRGFAAVNRDATKAMFSNLFDEKKDLAVRVERFREDAEHIRREYVRHLEAALSEIERHQYVFVAPLSRPVLPVQLFRLPCRSERTP